MNVNTWHGPEPQIQVTYGPYGDRQSRLVRLDYERFTPTVARRAARIACGHDNGVTVTEMASGTTYRITASSARKIQSEDWTATSEAAAALGSQGGKSTSEAKAAAARRNGRKGGRPRKEHSN